MTNFGILMEIKGIEDPFRWSRDVVERLQVDGTGLYYSPNRTRKPGLTSEGTTRRYVKHNGQCSLEL